MNGLDLSLDTSGGNYKYAKPMVVPSLDRNGKPVAKEVYSSAQYETLTRVLIEQIKDAGYTSIIAVARGGLPILAMMEKYGKGVLPTNLRFGVLHAASYEGEGDQKEVHIADCISFLNGGGPGEKPLFLDDMFDSARSKIAIDKWAGQHSINGQRWGVAIQKESSTEDADHVVQRVSKRWVLQPQEYWDPKTPGNNIAKIICTPEHNFSPEGNFDNLQRLAEFISLRIDKSKFQPSSIIGTGDIRSAHTAAMVSRILCLPSGTHLTGGKLSFINPEASQKTDLGQNPLGISLPPMMPEINIASILKTGGNLEQIFTQYQN